MTVPHRLSIAAIHDDPTRAVVAVTGGGVAALQWLLSVPGASRTILEGMVPYAAASLRSLLGGDPPAGAASAVTAVAMAEACLRRARALAAAEDATAAPEGTDAAGAAGAADGADRSGAGPATGGEAPDRPLVGVAATAALVSDRPKKGEHRAHVALARSDGTTAVWTITLDKGARDRSGEDAVVSELVIAALAAGCGLTPEASGLTGADVLEPGWPTPIEPNPPEATR